MESGVDVSTVLTSSHVPVFKADCRQRAEYIRTLQSSGEGYTAPARVRRRGYDEDVPRVFLRLGMKFANRGCISITSKSFRIQVGAVVAPAPEIHHHITSCLLT